MNYYETVKETVAVAMTLNSKILFGKKAIKWLEKHEFYYVRHQRGSIHRFLSHNCEKIDKLNRVESLELTAIIIKASIKMRKHRRKNKMPWTPQEKEALKKLKDSL